MRSGVSLSPPGPPLMVQAPGVQGPPPNLRGKEVGAPGLRATRCVPERCCHLVEKEEPLPAHSASAPTPAVGPTHSHAGSPWDPCEEGLLELVVWVGSDRRETP